MLQELQPGNAGKMYLGAYQQLLKAAEQERPFTWSVLGAPLSKVET